jgi:hypothetical protein
MTRHALRGGGIVCLIVAACAGTASLARAASLDEDGEIRLGVRAYTGLRIGSEDTDKNIQFATNQDGSIVVDQRRDGTLSFGVPRQSIRSLTFPVSSAGHVRQHRYFVEAELDHDLTRLYKEGFGPFALFNRLPFEMRKFRYHVTYRGEGEGIYDYGPSEYRTARQYFDDTTFADVDGERVLVPYPDVVLLPPFTSGGAVLNRVDVDVERRRLRRVAQNRQRLFQAFLEAEVGNLNTRFGRQILVWGEADVFRLLDNINPIDNGFGGFLVSLDERRVPLDMLVLNYWLDDLWGMAPVYGTYVEFFGAIDSRVSYKPGIPTGSPWAPPNLGDPSATLITTREDKDRNFDDARFGFLVNTSYSVPRFSDLRLQFAHYYTYFDLPGVEIVTTRNFPAAFSEADGAPPGTTGFFAIARQTAPRVQVTGGSASFGIPAEVSRLVGLSGEPQIRMELAYFANEPRYTQSNIDPFLFATGGCPNPENRIGGDNPEPGAIGCTGRRDTGSSVNFVLGIDHNQYIRFLNPNQSFFITTQFFYRHLRHPQKRRGIQVSEVCDPNDPTDPEDLGCVISDGEVLPIPELEIAPQGLQVGASEPLLVRHPVDQYLQTLLIFTSYYSGQINPSLTVLYDWSGGYTLIPQVTFSRDPFRFTMSYSYLDANRLKGGSGVSLLRDRDNFLFQFEYVI